MAPIFLLTRYKLYDIILFVTWGVISAGDYHTGSVKARGSNPLRSTKKRVQFGLLFFYATLTVVVCVKCVYLGDRVHSFDTPWFL